MKKKPTYEELEEQLDQLKDQIEFLRINSTFHNEEKEKRAHELDIANKMN